MDRARQAVFLTARQAGVGKTRSRTLMTARPGLRPMNVSDDAPLPASGAGALTAAAFVAPWALLAFALPEPWRWKELVLLVTLGLLLVAAAAVAERIAARKGLDPTWWAFLAVVTLGYGLIALLRWPDGKARGSATYLCGQCARVGSIHEPFCFGCGTYG